MHKPGNNYYYIQNNNLLNNLGLNNNFLQNTGIPSSTGNSTMDIIGGILGGLCTIGLGILAAKNGNIGGANAPGNIWASANGNYLQNIGNNTSIWGATTQIAGTTQTSATQQTTQTSTSAKMTDITQKLNSAKLKEVVSKTVPEKYREQVLEYLDTSKGHITTADEGDTGAARYDSESGKIIINTATLENSSIDDVIKILIHEAMHAAQKSEFNTQEEELTCEMTAIRTRAELINAGESQDENIYGKSYTELNAMSDEDLRAYLQENFIGSKDPSMNGVGPYSNRPVDSTGKIVLQDTNGHKITLDAGSKFNINGKEYTLGEDVFIEGISGYASTVCQMFTIVDGKPQGIGMISFEDLSQLPQEEGVPPIKEHSDKVNSGDFIAGNITSGDSTYNFKITNFHDIK